MLDLWRIVGVTLVSSSYAVAEARRNLEEDRADAVSRLDKLLEPIELVEAGADEKLPCSVHLDPKDGPILLAAIRAEASYLATGDRRHFGHLFGESVQGVRIVRIAEFLRSRRRTRFKAVGR